MPSNRKRRVRHRQINTLDTTQVEYLLTGADPPEGTAGWSLMLSHQFFDGPEKIQRLWRENRQFLLDVWRRKGEPGKPWGAQFDDDHADGGRD